MCQHDNMGVMQRYLQQVAPERHWDMDAVRRLLMNPVYVGILKWKQHVNEGVHEPIVERAIWDEVQALIVARAERPTAGGGGRTLPYRKENRSDIYPYYLRGHVFCDHCDCRMTPTDHHGRISVVRYYQCTRGSSSCPTKYVNATKLHEVVLDEIARAAMHPTRLHGLIREAVKALPSASALKDELARQQRNRHEAQKNLNACIRGIEATGTRGATLTSLAKRIAELEERIAGIDDEMRRVEFQIAESEGRRPDAALVGEAWQHVIEAWAHLTDPERVELLPLIVEEVRMEAKQKGTLRLSLQCSLSQVRVFEPKWVRG